MILIYPSPPAEHLSRLVCGRWLKLVLITAPVDML
jgi:hypothetical protein